MCPPEQWGIQTTYAEGWKPWLSLTGRKGVGKQEWRWLRALPTIILFVFQSGLFKLSLSLLLFIQEVIKLCPVNFVVGLTCKQGTDCTSYRSLSQTSQGVLSPLIALWSLSCVDVICSGRKKAQFCGDRQGGPSSTACERSGTGSRTLCPYGSQMRIALLGTTWVWKKNAASACIPVIRQPQEWCVALFIRKKSQPLRKFPEQWL